MFGQMLCIFPPILPDYCRPELPILSPTYLLLLEVDECYNQIPFKQNIFVILDETDYGVQTIERRWRTIRDPGIGLMQSH